MKRADEALGRPWVLLGLISRLIVGGVFVYASLDKIMHPDQFAEVIYNYMLIPTELVNMSAIILPWVELTAGLLLILGRFPWPSTFVLTALTLIFIAALGYNLYRGLDFHCGCFTTSPDANNVGMETLIRDVFMLVPAFICLKVYSWRKRLAA